jgi:SAM-dependent methyltransferase
VLDGRPARRPCAITTVGGGVAYSPNTAAGPRGEVAPATGSSLALTATSATVDVPVDAARPSLTPAAAVAARSLRGAGGPPSSSMDVGGDCAAADHTPSAIVAGVSGQYSGRYAARLAAMASDDGVGWTDEHIDLRRPNVARMYDYYLGGSHNFAADRQAAEQVRQAAPAVFDAARANRAFLRRVVTYAVRAGIRQFLDLGSGIPTVGHTHQVAHDLDPDTRIVYVDVDSVAVAHTRHLLHGSTTAAVIEADLRDADTILHHPHARRLLDPHQPTGVLAVSVLHFVPGDLPALLAPYRQLLGPGGVLALSHATRTTPTPQTQQVEHVYTTHTSTGLHLRPADQLRAALGGLIPVEPGLVPVHAWRPDTPPPATANSPFLTGFLAIAATAPPHRKPIT